MSPLWRDRMQVFLAPGRVDLARLQRGIKPKQAARLAAACEQKPGLPAWEAPLEQFEQNDRKCWRRGHEYHAFQRLYSLCSPDRSTVNCNPG